MSISQSLLPEFDQEMATTRKVVERVPANLDYKPHEKSMTMGQLMGHVVDMVGWTAPTVGGDYFDVNPPGGEPYKSKEFASAADAVKAFDEYAAAARKAIEGCSDADFMKQWELRSQGKALFAMPKIVCIRSFVMNHIIHHRGQLSVYLQLNNVPVPAIYGPSADEGSM
ncbi:MAG: DinB family protein [Bryobacteraceae bacterium]